MDGDAHEQNPAPPPEEIKRILGIIADLLNNDEKLAEALAAAIAQGFMMKLQLTVEYTRPNEPSTSQPIPLKEPKPLVQNGEVVRGTFTQKDKHAFPGVRIDD